MTVRNNYYMYRYKFTTKQMIHVQCRCVVIACSVTVLNNHRKNKFMILFY